MVFRPSLHQGLFRSIWVRYLRDILDREGWKRTAGGSKMANLCLRLHSFSIQGLLTEAQRKRTLLTSDVYIARDTMNDVHICTKETESGRLNGAICRALDAGTSPSTSAVVTTSHAVSWHCGRIWRCWRAGSVCDLYAPSL